MAWLELWTDGYTGWREKDKDWTDNEDPVLGETQKDQTETERQRTRDPGKQEGSEAENIDREWGIVSWEEDESGPYLRSVSTDW